MKRAECEVSTDWGLVWIYAQPGKVGMQGFDTGTLNTPEARALGRALTEAAEMAEAQEVLKTASDEGGAHSQAAEAARAALKALQDRATD